MSYLLSLSRLCLLLVIDYSLEILKNRKNKNHQKFLINQNKKQIFNMPKSGHGKITDGNDTPFHILFSLYCKEVT